MARFKIGVTEAGDAGLDLSWEEKLDTIDGAILITKNITPEFHDAILRHKDKVILHATITGYGQSIVEQNVPHPENELDRVDGLIADGFPEDRLVIRVDPIIPTRKGIRRAEIVMTESMYRGHFRFRASVIDMYQHAINRFKAAGLPSPYPGDNFQPSAMQLQAVDDMFVRVQSIFQSIQKKYEECDPEFVKVPELRIEACAEPGLTRVIQCGCVSAYDLELLGLIQPGEELDKEGRQRPHCLCYSGKTELLSVKAQCPNECLYCYWK